MLLQCIPTGMFGSNSYIIGDSGEAVVIDAGVSANEIIEVLNRNDLVLKYVILTHGHLDHICSVDELRNLTQAKLAIHEDDADCMVNDVINGSAMFDVPKTYKPAEIFLKDGDTLKVGGQILEVIHTPGHTVGGICIKAGQDIFTGDTLFNMGIGRTDFPGGSRKQIITSIKEKLLTLDGNITVHPGHGEPTTIAFERDNNPFLRRF